jgi:sigma-54 dependent transcriptional regulator, acetoin dehydrogenase operon transcriptional activator AcoR
MNYNWPGNIRHMQNTIQFALIKCKENVIYPHHLPPEILQNSFNTYLLPKTPGKAGRKPKLSSEIVNKALSKTGGNKAKAARFLGVGRATLYNFLNQKDEAENANKPNTE